MGLSLKRKQERFAARLNQLANYLETVVAPRVQCEAVHFNMWKWATVEPRPELSCGTVACAAGYGTIIFAKNGFRLKMDSDGSLFVVDANNGTQWFEACRTFFGCEQPFDPQHFVQEYAIDEGQYRSGLEDEGWEFVAEGGERYSPPLSLVVSEIRKYAKRMVA